MKVGLATQRDRPPRSSTVLAQQKPEIADVLAPIGRHVRMAARIHHVCCRRVRGEAHEIEAVLAEVDRRRPRREAHESGVRRDVNDVGRAPVHRQPVHMVDLRRGARLLRPRRRRRRGEPDQREPDAEAPHVGSCRLLILR